MSVPEPSLTLNEQKFGYLFLTRNIPIVSIKKMLDLRITVMFTCSLIFEHRNGGINFLSNMSVSNTREKKSEMLIEQ